MAQGGTPAGSTATTTTGNAQALAANLAARGLVLSQAVEMENQIFSQSFNPTTQLSPVTVPLRNVGLIKRLRVIVSGTIQNTDGAVDAVRTPFGIQNVISNFTFTDLQNNQRINTTGWHLAQLASVKNMNPYASSLTAADFKNSAGTLESCAGDYGNNFPVITDLVGLVHGTSQAFRMVYEVPFAYSDDDLRGSIWGNVVNATQQMQMTINPAATAFVANGVDDTQAILSKGTCSYSGNITITVYQVYLDQIPVGQNGAVLPLLDLSTIYELKLVSGFTNLAAGQEFPIPFANFRDFLSWYVIYNNNGAQGHGNGSDINYWSLQSANFTNIWKLDPLSVAERWRKILPMDPPEGAYYFSFRRKPISTTQYGNMELIINPITAASGNYIMYGSESFGLQNVITNAGSLNT